MQLLIIIVALFALTVLVGAPYVPTHQKQLDKLFTYLKLNKQDVLVDLGSGDGRVLRVASPFVKQAIGYEINPFLILYSKLLSRQNPNIQIKLSDFRQVKIAKNAIIYIFDANTFRKQLLNLMAKSEPKMVISYGFEIMELGEGEQKYGFWIYQNIKSLPKTAKTSTI